MTEPSFEQRFGKLEEILKTLEGGELPLDSALKGYEQGIAALRDCREVLAQAKLRVEELAANAPSS